MAIWDNIKNTNHSAEKTILSFILYVGLAVGFFYGVSKLVETMPDIRAFLSLYQKSLLIFLFAAIGIFAVSLISYLISLDEDEAETKKTYKATVLSIALWSVFWVIWGIYCAWISATYTPISGSVKLLLGGFLLVPVCVAVYASNSLRNAQIKQEQVDRELMGADYYLDDPYTLHNDKKYFSGYYSLLCLPAFLVTALVLHLF